jgi:hypothetical protein
MYLIYASTDGVNYTNVLSAARRSLEQLYMKKIFQNSNQEGCIHITGPPLEWHVCI